MKYAAQGEKMCYLPVLQTTDQLEFRLYKNPQSLNINRYGIPEPQIKCPSIDKLALHLVLVPLVAFDESGNRIGMGGGYYDRTFAAMRKYPARGPVLMGLAHACQQVDAIESDAWDIPMHYIATDEKIIRLT